MAVKDLQKKLDTITAENKSNWLKQAKARKETQSWLKHSQQVAVKVNTYLKKHQIKQIQLAEMLEVSLQQVSKILKGKENLTLATITKIEEVLGIDILVYS